MTDIELLKLAAKAAGYKADWHSPEEDTYGIGFFTVDGSIWNPLEDYGPALQLSVQLEISIEYSRPWDKQSYVAAFNNGQILVRVVVELVESDRGAATRRAIVRAAAEIGEAMP